MSFQGWRFENETSVWSTPFRPFLTYALVSVVCFLRSLVHQLFFQGQLCLQTRALIMLCLHKSASVKLCEGSFHQHRCEAHSQKLGGAWPTPLKTTAELCICVDGDCLSHSLTIADLCRNMMISARVCSHSCSWERVDVPANGEAHYGDTDRNGEAHYGHKQVR